MVSGSEDLFNRLPEPLLCHILSFLSTKEAASTSILSKRWRDLLAFVPYLEFDDSVYLHPERRVKDPLEGTPDYLDGFWTCIGDKLMKLSTSFPDFVDRRTLALQGKYPVNKFFLKIVDEEDPVDPDCVNPWIENVLERGVSDFHLVIKLDSDSTLTPRIFLTETLVKLRLKNRDGPNIDIENVYLPNLKYLHLESVYFEEDDIGFNKLLSGCPILEELVLDDFWSRVWDTFSVSLKTLKKLKFRCLLGDTGEELAYKVSFDTPNVVYLEYTELIAEKYPKLKFDSLVEAKINLLKLEDHFYDDMVGNATDFIMEISNVRVLYLSANTLEVLTLSCNAIPIFRNLTHLTIQSKAEVGWESLPRLLKNCPKLETLVFEGLYHKATDSCGDVCLCNHEEKDAEVTTCLSTSPVKVLKIFINDDKTEKQTEQVKHFLKTMPNLEQLVLYYDPSFDEEVVAQLTKVASPKCKIQLIPDYNLRVSSNKPSKRVISRAFLDSD